MRMQDRACAAAAYDGQVQSRLGGRPPGSTDHPRLFVDFQELLRRERALVQPGRRDRQAQRLPAYHGAEIPAGSEEPSTLIEAASDLGKCGGQILKARPRSATAGTA